MCGGAALNRMAPLVAGWMGGGGGGNYTPPSLQDVYAQFRETGRVPYSYYGAGLPTRDGEADRVRASYPGAFSNPAQPGSGQPGGLEGIKNLRANMPADAMQQLIAAMKGRPTGSGRGRY